MRRVSRVLRSPGPQQAVPETRASLRRVEFFWRRLRSDRGSCRSGKERLANGTSVSDGRAGRITRNYLRSWSGRMRPDRGGAEVLPIHSSRPDLSRRFERFAEVCQGLTSRGRSHPGLRWLANLRFEVSRLLPAVYCQPNIATTPRARKRKLIPHAGHEFGLWRREVSWEGGLSHKSQQPPVACSPAVCPPTAYPPAAASPRLPTFPFVMCRDGPPQLVIRRKHPVVAMPVLPWRRHEIGEPVEELNWRELDNAIVPCPACGTVVDMSFGFGIDFFSVKLPS